MSRPLYSAFAPYYEDLFGAVDQACLDFVQSTVPPPAALLDAGCGTGQYALALAARGYRVVAADRECGLLSQRALGPAADWVVADLRSLPFSESFDVVLARGVLNDLVGPGDLDRALKSIASALKPQGRFICDVREREAHRVRVAAQPTIERASGNITFRAERSMDNDGTLISVEWFAQEGRWSQPFRFTMRTFSRQEVHNLWQDAGLELLSVGSCYGAASRLHDRLVVVARRL